MTATTSQQVAPGVHRLTDGLVNLYLVEEGGRLLVVDTGLPRTFPVLERGVAALGRSLTDVAAVLLTHGHPDHLGGAERLRRQAGVPVRCAPEEVERVTSPGSSPWKMVPGLVPTLYRPASLAFVVKATLQGFLFPRGVARVEPFVVGEELDLPGRPTPVGTPGHTEGHVSYLLAEHGVLVTGDALLTVDPLSGETGPRVAPPPLNSDHAAAQRSLDVLEPLEATVLLPGHGEPFRGAPAQAVAEARRRL